MIEQTIHSRKLDILRRRINEEDYLHAAIQRLAFVLSKELVDINRSKDVMQNKCEVSLLPEGGKNEQQRKRRESG